MSISRREIEARRLNEEAARAMASGSREKAERLAGRAATERLLARFES